jgi:hypothetical protein
MPEDDVLAELGDHPRGDLTGKGSFFRPVHILCAQPDIGAFQKSGDRKERHEWRA